MRGAGTPCAQHWAGSATGLACAPAGSRAADSSLTGKKSINFTVATARRTGGPPPSVVAPTRARTDGRAGRVTGELASGRQPVLVQACAI